MEMIPTADVHHPVPAAHLNGLPVVLHAAVRLAHWAQSLLSALGEDLEVRPQPLVALQLGQQPFELSLSLSLAGLCCSKALSQLVQGALEAGGGGGVRALKEFGNRVPCCLHTTLPGEQLLTKFLGKNKGQVGRKGL